MYEHAGGRILELHGKQSQAKRLDAYEEFNNRSEAVVLLCTDVAARGIDFPRVDWVLQVDCPDCVETYIHRVGRTARYMSSGHGLLLLNPSEVAFASRLAASKVWRKGGA
jgi:ATP-dependent RNA helicase DDX10/DBP4